MKKMLMVILTTVSMLLMGCSEPAKEAQSSIDTPVVESDALLFEDFINYRKNSSDFKDKFTFQSTVNSTSMEFIAICLSDSTIITSVKLKSGNMRWTLAANDIYKETITKDNGNYTRKLYVNGVVWDTYISANLLDLR